MNIKIDFNYRLWTYEGGRLVNKKSGHGKQKKKKEKKGTILKHDVIMY